ncbi:MAG: hypothetical protein ACLQLH_14670 [Terracidiphilus sp.]|jgi:hypothetical protein
MKKFSFWLLVIGFVFVFATTVSAGTLEKQGKDWLDKQTDPAAINVSGTWGSEFGELRLDQAAGSRDVSGSGGGYNLNGVVSGKRLYLIFATNRGTVDYCAVVSSESDGVLSGEYYSRLSRLRMGTGLCQEKSRRLLMHKR